MSQKTKYYCDHCNKEIGNNPHISLGIANLGYSGIALPPSHSRNPKSEYWHVDQFEAGLKHFCTSKCLGQYFEKILKEATKAQ